MVAIEEFVMIRRKIMTPEQHKEHLEKMRLSGLKHLDNMIAIETLKYSMEESSTRKKAIQIRAAVLELRKEQFIKDGSW